MSDPDATSGSDNPATPAAPAAPRPPPARRRLPWLLLPLGVWIAARVVPLPGVDMNFLENADSLLERSSTSVLLMGLDPIVAGYVLVELAAVLVPPWRPLRHTRRGRESLSLAALLASLAVTTLNGWHVVSALAGAGAVIGPWYVPLLTLLAITALVWAALHAADRNGAGSSFALVIGLAGLESLVRGEVRRWQGGAIDPDLPGPSTLLLLLSLAGFATVLVLKKRVEEPPGPGGRQSISIRIPPGGLVPFWLTSGLWIGGLLGVGSIPGVQWFVQVHWLVWIGTFSVVLSWLSYSPSRVGAAWARLFDPGATAPRAEATAEPREATGEPAAEPDASTPERAEARAAHLASVDAAYAPPSEAAEAPPLAGASPEAERPIPPGKAAGWTARAWRLLLRAMLPALAYYVIVAWPAWPVLDRPDEPWRRMAGVAGTCLLVAAIVDIVAETRFRRAHRDATALLTELRPYAADAALAALASAGVPAYARSSGVRTLLSFFGPFAPAEILVPAALLPRARERLAAALEQDATSAGERPAGGDGKGVEPRPQRKAGGKKRRKPKAETE